MSFPYSKILLINGKCTLKYYCKKCFVQTLPYQGFDIHRAVKSFLAQMFLASSLTVDRLSTNRCHFFIFTLPDTFSGPRVYVTLYRGDRLYAKKGILQFSSKI